jgi:N-acetylated-alpha-linked acidic dipeptidase
LQNALARVQESARNYERAISLSLTNGRTRSLDAQRKLDGILIQTERSLLQSEGLPRRPWYKHSIYAPGFYTGYGVKTLPGIREAIEERHWKEAEEQIQLAAQALERFDALLEKAAALLRQNP